MISVALTEETFHKKLLTILRRVQVHQYLLFKEIMNANIGLYQFQRPQDPCLGSWAVIVTNTLRFMLSLIDFVNLHFNYQSETRGQEKHCREGRMGYTLYTPYRDARNTEK